MERKLNSSIYTCVVSHTRLEPKKNSFKYGIFTFLLDLDEIPEIHKKSFLFSHNSWNLFSFYDSDFLQMGKKNLKENIIMYLQKEGIDAEIEKVILLTNIRVLGYVFNPVCFYYCLNAKGETKAIVVEVHNTFGELKPYLLREEDSTKDRIFIKKFTKYFYVSPFQDLETEFEFRIGAIEDSFRIDIDDYKDGRKVFLSNYKGKRNPLTTGSLLAHFFRFPLVTLRIIGLIHWQAFKLWLKGIPYYKKIQNLELQRGVYNGKNNYE